MKDYLKRAIQDGHHYWRCPHDRLPPRARRIHRQIGRRKAAVEVRRMVEEDS